MSDSDERTVPASNDNPVVGSQAQGVHCTATRFKVRVDKVLLTGAVKAKYELQGGISLLGYHQGHGVALRRIKGEPNHNKFICHHRPIIRRHT